MKLSLLGFCIPWAEILFPKMSSSFTMDVDDNHDHHPSNPFQLDNHDSEESLSDSFICCVCLDLLYKPIVLECGHVSCFWCVHLSMDQIRESHCPICRNPYHHFPTICEMLHFLLSKTYPLAYKRRKMQVLAEEEKMGYFSPQLDEQELNGVARSGPSHFVNSTADVPSPCIISEDKDCSKLNTDGSAATKENSLPAVDDQTCSRVSRADVLCPTCKELLFRPAVLNCGHVFCEACIVVPEDGVIICKVCEIPHPSVCPNVCLELNRFLEEQFPIEYAERKENAEQKEARFQHKNSSSCSGTNKCGKKGTKSCRGGDDFIPWWIEHGSKVHVHVGCDYCGMFPIVGDRYRCKDCAEAIGFDLCEGCYNTRSKRPGRFNQQHTQDHQFELLKKGDILSNMLRFVGGNLVDSSGTPVLAISALDDSLDGWVAVESSVASQNIDDIPADFDGNHGDVASQHIDDNLVDPDANHGDDMNVDTQDSSIYVEQSDAPQTSSNDDDRLARDDHSMDHHLDDSAGK